jgi:hypothetical protein
VVERADALDRAECQALSEVAIPLVETFRR